jgi:hypothetical protein
LNAAGIQEVIIKKFVTFSNLNRAGGNSDGSQETPDNFQFMKKN